MMNGCEIVFFIWSSMLTIGFTCMVSIFLNRINELEDTVTNLHSYIDCSLGPQIKRIRQLVLDEITNKEDSNVTLDEAIEYGVPSVDLASDAEWCEFALEIMKKYKELISNDTLKSK